MDTLFKYSSDQISLLRNNKLEYFLVAFFSGLIYFLSTAYFGLGITNDSVNYLSAAQTITEGMKKADGTAYTEWPPLFPVILSLSNLLHINILLFAKLINGLAYITTIITMLHLIKINIKTKTVYIFSLIILIFSTPLLQVHVLIWSEPIFILLILLNIILLHYYSHSQNLKYFILLIVIGIAMYLQRKTGTIFIASTTLLIFILNKSKEKKIIFSLLYLICCSIPVYWWYKRRLDISGKVFGAAGLEPGKIFNNLEEFFHTFSSYFFPSTLPISIRFILIFLLLISILVYLIKNKKTIQTLTNNLSFKLSSFHVLFYYLTLIVFLIYIHIDESIDDRILSPVYLPVLLSLSILLDIIFSYIKENDKRSYLLFSIIIILWLAYPVFRMGYNINRWRTDGTGGYNSRPWLENKMITLFNTPKAPKTTDTLYTNNINSLKYFLNFKAQKNYTILDDENLDDEKKGYLVCFDKSLTYPEKICIADRLRKKKIFIKNRDGEIWQLNP